MKLKLFALRDSATNQYGNVMTFVAPGQALRTIADEMRNNESPLGKHPSDFEIYELGEYDVETGMIEPQTPRSVARLADLAQATKT